MADVLSDIDYVDHATKTVRTAVVASYVDGLWWSHGKFRFLRGVVIRTNAHYPQVSPSCAPFQQSSFHSSSNKGDSTQSHGCKVLEEVPAKE